MCECDRNAASCFKKTRPSFDPAKFNVTDRVECCSVSPPSDKCEQWSGEWEIAVRLDEQGTTPKEATTPTNKVIEEVDDSAAATSGGNLAVFTIFSVLVAAMTM